MNTPGTILRHPFRLYAVKIYFAAALIFSVVAAFVPLLSSFGFEYAILYATVCSFFAAAAGASLAHNALKSDETPKEAVLLQYGMFDFSVKSIGLLFLVSLPPTLIFAALTAMTGQTCSWSQGMIWYGLMVPPAVMYAAMWGIAFGVLIRRRSVAIILAVVLVFLVIAKSVYEMAVGPQAFCYNAFFGYFPGPIYDYYVPLSPALVAFRFLNFAKIVLIGAVLVVPVKLRANRREGHVAYSLSYREVLFGAIALAAVALFHLHFQDLGLTSSPEWIREELSATRKTEHFEIHYPPDGPVADQIDFIAADHEFRYHQITTELGIKFDRAIESYVYLYDDQKKRLQGTGPTMYADVSNAAMHMSYRGFPHDVLKHEMTHIITAVWGMPFFGWSSEVGLTEGIATSREGYRDDYTIHQWAAAMKELDKLPDIVDIMGPIGFWSKVGSRSYLAAGSFSLWLIQTEGLEKYREAYTWGAFEKVFGEPLETLRDRWLAFLDEVPVSDRLLLQAKQKFFRRSLFTQRCAREVARLMHVAEDRFDHRRYHDAVAILREARYYADNNPKTELLLMYALQKAKMVDDALDLGREIIEKQGGLETLNPEYEGDFSARPVIRAFSDIAEIQWMQGDRENAEQAYKIMAGADYNDSYTRHALVALAGLNDPNIEPYVRAYMASAASGDAQVIYMTEGAMLFPENPTMTYLLGRRLYLEHRYFDAVTPLLRLLNVPKLPAVLRLEVLQMLGESMYFQRRFLEARVMFELMLDEYLTPGRRMETEDWIDRVEFTKTFFEQPESGDGT